MKRLLIALTLVATFWAMPHLNAVVINPTGYPLQLHASGSARCTELTQ